MLLAGQAVANNESRLTLTLLEKVDVRQSDVRLDNIVSAVTGDMKLYQKIRETKLAELERVNQFKLIDTDKIRYLVSRLAGDVVAIRGGRSIAVRQLSRPFSVAKISHAIEADIDEKIRALYKIYQIEDLNKNLELKLPYGEVTHKYSLDNTRLGRRTCVWLDIYVNQKHYQTLPMWYEIYGYGPAYVAKQRIDKGMPISPDDFVLVDRELTLLHAPVAVGDLQNVRVSSVLQEGEVLLSEHLEKLPAVYKGQLVKVIAEYGDVVINTTGIANEDGNKGGVITVSRDGSMDEFRGIVLGSGIVRATGG